MPLTTSQAFTVVFVVAAITFLCRALPFVLFRDSSGVSGLVVYLGRVLPFAIIPILVVYCFRSTDLFTYPHGLPQLIAGVIAVVVHLIKRNNLLSIGISTAAYMIMIQTIFV